MRLGYCLLFAVLVFPTTPLASVTVYLRADAEGSSCTIPDPGPGQLVAVYALVTTWLDEVTGVRFAAPVPSTSGLTHVADSTPFSYSFTGNSQYDISVPFDGCESGTVMFLTMYFLRTSTGETCTLYLAQPGGLYSDCTYTERQLVTGDGVALNAGSECTPSPIHDISPLDGAVDQPLTVSLSWKDGNYGVCNIPLAAKAPTSDSAELYFGTSPNPRFVDVVTPPHAVGPLQPATTYYWRLYMQGTYMGTPVMSFTTTNRVATMQSTWGAIKALYR